MSTDDAAVEAVMRVLGCEVDEILPHRHFCVRHGRWATDGRGGCGLAVHVVAALADQHRADVDAAEKRGAVKALLDAAEAYGSGQLTGMFFGRDDYPRAWLRARADRIEAGR